MGNKRVLLKTIDCNYKRGHLLLFVLCWIVCRAALAVESMQSRGGAISIIELWQLLWFAHSEGLLLLLVTLWITVEFLGNSVVSWFTWISHTCRWTSSWSHVVHTMRFSVVIPMKSSEVNHLTLLHNSGLYWWCNDVLCWMCRNIYIHKILSPVS